MSLRATVVVPMLNTLKRGCGLLVVALVSPAMYCALSVTPDEAVAVAVGGAAVAVAVGGGGVAVLVGVLVGGAAVAVAVGGAAVAVAVGGAAVAVAVAVAPEPPGSVPQISVPL